MCKIIDHKNTGVKSLGGRGSDSIKCLERSSRALALRTLTWGVEACSILLKYDAWVNMEGPGRGDIWSVESYLKWLSKTWNYTQKSWRGWPGGRVEGANPPVVMGPWIKPSGRFPSTPGTGQRVQRSVQGAPPEPPTGPRAPGAPEPGIRRPYSCPRHHFVNGAKTGKFMTLIVLWPILIIEYRLFPITEDQ